ncbi:MAG: hypothetical protein JWQ87_128 [Candidatus Sulfotelmatobacter sp.]|nr:hypothetical protein [Candidatus Sulfotelmatobacter sp.]
MDRLARSLKQFVSIADECRLLNVDLVSLRQSIDPSCLWAGAESCHRTVKKVALHKDICAMTEINLYKVLTFDWFVVCLGRSFVPVPPCANRARPDSLLQFRTTILQRLRVEDADIAHDGRATVSRRSS